MRAVALVLVVVFGMFALVPPVLAQEGLLGQVVAVGQAQVNPDGKGGVGLKGSYPLRPGMKFRTADGRMSLLFQDGTRVELGGASELAVRAGPQGHVLQLGSGKIGLHVPATVRLRVQTPDLLSVQFQNATGGVLFDGQKSQVMVVSGKVKVLSRGGQVLREVPAGELFTASAKGYQTVAVGQALAGGAARRLLAVVLLAGGTAAAAVAIQDEDEEAASPASP